MALTDIAGLFSRYFIIGFFLPTFFALFLYSRVVDPSFLPSDYNQAREGTQVLVVGGAALLVALVLSAVHHPLLRLFEGYPLKKLRDLPGGLARVGSAIYALAMWRSLGRFKKLVQRRAAPNPSPRRTIAAQTLARRFPDSQEQLLPTRFGNAIRSFERHPRERYGLDGVTAWPRIELLLSEQEREVVTNAETNVAFFINATVLLPLMGGAFIGDAIVNEGLSAPWWLLYAIPFVAAWATYRGAVVAAIRWGDPVRAAFDMHRIDLYRRLGVRQPSGPKNEARLARAVNRMLLYGEPLDAELRIEEHDAHD